MFCVWNNHINLTDYIYIYEGTNSVISIKSNILLMSAETLFPESCFGFTSEQIWSKRSSVLSDKFKILIEIILEKGEISDFKKKFETWNA